MNALQALFVFPLSTLLLASIFACSSNGSPNGATGSDAGVDESFSGDTRCKVSLCPGETLYDYSKSDCDQVRATQTKAGCIGPYDAYRACVQVHEKCLPNGLQDRATVKPACDVPFSAWNSCSAGDGG